MKTLCKLIISLLIAVTPATVWAEPWDGVTKTKPEGAGTPENPYKIASGANLYWLASPTSTTTYWGPGIYYEQTADIDLGGHPLNAGLSRRGIGFYPTAFRAIYDGRGYTISNFYCEINNTTQTDNANISYGLFGYVTGNSQEMPAVLRNIVLDNAELRFVPQTVSTSVDLKIGLLAGAIGPYTEIANVIINNSRVTAGEVSDDPAQQVSITTAFIGGVVGDFTSGFAGTATDNISTSSIRNIAAQIDFDLGNFHRQYTSDTGKGCQYDVGGVVGRIRKRGLDDLPDNVWYSGTITAPVAMAGNLWGASRANTTTANATNISQVYSGEYQTTTNKFVYIGGPGAITPEEADQNRYYDGYRLYNPLTDQIEEMTADYPTSKYLGTRTLGPIPSDADFNAYAAAPMAGYQGVNHGKHVSVATSDTDRQEVLTMFKRYASEHADLMTWRYNSTTGRFELTDNMEFRGDFIGDRTYQAVVICPQEESYMVRWYVNGEQVYDELTDADFHSSYRIPKFGMTGEITAELRDIDGTPICDEFGHPYRVVMPIRSVYEEMTLSIGRATVNVAAGERTGYVATITNPTTHEIVHGAGTIDPTGSVATGGVLNPDFVWRWSVSSDPSSERLWENTDLHSFFESEHQAAMAATPAQGAISTQKNWIVPYNPDRFYRVAWCMLKRDDDNNYVFRKDGNGNDIWVSDAQGNMTRIHEYVVLLEDVIGPRNIIFVYDKVKSERGYNLGVTTFDGHDTSTDLDFPDGNDSYTGHTPYQPVKTMRRAYELLRPELGRADNVIVVMGYCYDSSTSTDPVAWLGTNKYYHGSCTITGSFGDLIYDGALNLAGGSESLNLQGHTEFNNITWVGYVNPQVGNPTRGQLLLNTNLYDLCVGANVKVKRYAQLNTTTDNWGPIFGSVAPDITIVGGSLNYNKKTITYLDTKGQENPGFTTLTLQSGNIARVIAAARNTSRVAGSHNIYGSPQTPHRVKVKVAVTHQVPRGEESVSREYSPEDDYTYDIGMIVGGQTDGSTYSESIVDMDDGYVGRFVSGNISYGRDPNSAADDNYPSDSFFGSTTLSLVGGQIHELYGGSLGRHGENSYPTPTTECYFYGRSILNIKGGVVSGNIYGAGAGGVAGVGDDYYHTDDTSIPYNHFDQATGTYSLSYGPYDQIKANAALDGKTVADNVAKMTLVDGTVLDFYRSYCEVNISSGVIQGSVYGGGHGYSDQIAYNYASPLAGNLYGRSSVRMVSGDGAAPKIYGSVYGGGKGSRGFYDAALHDTTVPAAERQANADRYTALAMVFGDTEVNLEHGTVYGDVYGAGSGVYGSKFKQMASLVGNTKVIINGVTVNGNIFGGSRVADVLHHKGEEYANTPEHSGNTSVVIRRGVIGNNIFGGCEGYYTEAGAPDNTNGHVYGSTSVEIYGGSYIQKPYVTDYEDNEVLEGGSPKPRTFNIYGGGYVNSNVMGSTRVYIERALLNSPNSLTTDYAKAYGDLKYRRFCVYGGGFGDQTTVFGLPKYTKLTDGAGRPIKVPAAKVDINIVGTGGGVKLPDGDPTPMLVNNQTFFDVAGGGYSGDVGYWTKVDYQKNGNGDYVLDGAGNKIPIESTRRVIKDMIDAGETIELSDYCEYVNGDVEVHIGGMPYIRKVCGGGFYSSVSNSNTHIFSGQVGEVYGGALLGYVHETARLQIGTLNDDSAFTPAEVAYNNAHLFITGNVFGGNDVKGIVGTKLWLDMQFDPTNLEPQLGAEVTGGAPLLTSDVNDREDKGVNMFIFGGHIHGNVYGAGNGHYRGYYVPGWLRYEDGTPRQYRTVRAVRPEFKDPTNPANASHLEDPAYVSNLLLGPGGTPQRDSRGRVIYTGKVYRSQPMVGSVKIYIGGNSKGDRVNIRGNVYGGGRSCTIGQWNTVLPFEDPRRLSTGGYLHLNFGSHVTVGGDLFMGVSGAEYMSQQVIDPALGINLATFDGTDTEDLNRLGEIAYKHWYFDEDLGYYKPGFPPPGKSDGNFNMHGEHLFRAYLKKIEMNGDVELTFYTDPFRKDSNGNHIFDSTGNLVRKGWVPGELATRDYDATDIVVNSIYCGAECGSMTNNIMMRYDYTHSKPIPEDQVVDPAADMEQFGSIYRFTIPYGVTVRDKIVGGSKSSTLNYYRMSDDGTRLFNTREKTDEHGNVVTDSEGNPIMERAEPDYRFEGGIVTQAEFTYDLIVYCDRHGAQSTVLKPEDYLMDPSDPAYDEYTMSDGTHIYRRNYNPLNPFYPNAQVLNSQRYSVAEVEIDGVRHGYVGPRADRAAFRVPLGPDEVVDNTAVKLTVSCAFDPLSEAPDESSEVPDHTRHYGGLIYGGCYESGLTMGDVVINCTSNLLGEHVHDDDDNTNTLATLGHNVGRIFGGGYGNDSRVAGDTYVNLLHNFVGMNVFGGGCRGNVDGMCSVNYIGTETGSYIYGGIYGGGLYGYAGISDISRQATEVNLVSGNVSRVYGGSCLGDLYGRAEVNLTDRVAEYYDHLDYRRIRAIDPDFDQWAGSRLVVGAVFGGNDVSGNIYLPEPPQAPSQPLNPMDSQSVREWDDYNAALEQYETNDKYSTTVRIWEEPQIEAANSSSGSKRKIDTPREGAGSNAPIGPGKTSPGSDGGYNGFPLVGNLYGGSNGNYGVHGDNDHYADGVVNLATGQGASVMHLNLGGGSTPDPSSPNGTREYGAFQLPHLDYSRIIINGGTVINAYGGGDKATVSKQTDISVTYVPTVGGVKGNMDARAGFESDEEIQRVWRTCHITNEEQLTEVSHYDADGNIIFDNHIFRLFGGNNHADMHIQPTWHLERGHVGSVYSGGNFGRMTYCEGTPLGSEPDAKIIPTHGIRLNIDSRDFHAKAVYGGGRVGDVDPDLSRVDPALLDDNGNLRDPGDFYGALLEINEGVVDEVYGGNDVSGNVNYGAKVLITGAISGDVYCAGNGNYRYKYDPSIPPGSPIAEAYDDEIGGRYFILPQNPVYGGANPTLGSQKLLAINSYRPNIERAYLRIAGSQADHPAYVRGNVYCGGNSSSVHPNVGRESANSIIFDIGDNVVLNGVFLGSNGENLIKGEAITAIQYLNNIDLRTTNRITPADFDFSESIDPSFRTKALRDYLADDGIVPAHDKTLYGSLLDLYMRAVEVYDLPRDFQLSSTLSNAYIGSFYVGGNCGSMMTDKRIFLTFPESLVIYDKIVGGSNNASLTLGEIGNGGVPHEGGMTVPVDPTPDASGHVNTEKIHLVVKSRFEPWKLEYPLDNDYRGIRMLSDVVNEAGAPMFPIGKCMVYGGCYSTGTVVGDIAIDLFSDMVGEYDTSSAIGQSLLAEHQVGATVTKKRLIVNGVDTDSRRSFGIIGGGYGGGTKVMGNVKVRMLPGKVHPTYNPTATASNPYVSPKSPSAAMLFGGSQLGELVGNTTLEIRDGLVLTNTYGASEAAAMYGSTFTIVGWPEYYRCTQSHRFPVDRTDHMSKAAKEHWASADGRPAVYDFIYLREGEIISRPLYYQIADAVAPGVSKTDCFTLVTADQPHNFDTFHAGEFPADSEYTSGLTWDDININVGYRNSSAAPGVVESDADCGYYGHGNIYGGGFVTANSSISLAGQYTVRRFNALNCLDPADIDYGGNSMIIIWDNKENSVIGFTGDRATGTVPTNDGHSTVTGSGADIRDHVSIGTGRYVPVTPKVGDDIIGKYIWDAALGVYKHQSPHVLGTDTNGQPLADPNSDPLLANTYYAIESDGGIYGGGRKVYTEGFRHCDLSYYGYADYTPQHPKLLNTFQRLDLLSVTDCCLQLQGATDFATNNVDATSYSLTRIGELQMISSLDTGSPFNPGSRQNSGLCNILHLDKRTRNYIAFFNSVRYVASVTSSQAFSDRFHGADGQLYTTDDLLPSHAPGADGGSTPHLQPSIEGVDWANYPGYHDLPGSFSYADFKRLRIDNYYNLRDLPVPSDGVSSPELVANQNVKALVAREFDQRNIGTAANMIGINNGYTLKLQGSVVDAAGNDQTYYGPINGVVEVKLLTLAQNEGGGYIFALNHHDDPDHFLETTGNFVFPGAAYLVSSDPDQHYNYIYDDCFPMGQGWDSYKTKGDCNDLQEVHYWYVNGSNYYYNVTLTAYTYNDAIDFTLDNNDQLIYLYGLNPGSQLRIANVAWTDSENIDSDMQNVGVDGEGDYLKDYRLYLSVDKHPGFSHTTDPAGPYASNAFISPIPRAAYPGSGDPGVSLDDSSVINNYSDYGPGADQKNMPLLGISLIDRVDNTTKAYYDEHLREPEKVRLELVSKDGDTPFKYVVNLTIKYLLGPSITGHPEIENAALPGEYIYANSFGVTVDLDDDNMAVTNRNWYIVAPDVPLATQSDVRYAIDGINNPDPALRVAGEKLNDEKFDSDRQIHVPAYLYRDGWHLIYEIIANNMPFYLLPSPQTDEDGYIIPYTDHLVVRNYHRMRPYDGVSIEEVDGAIKPKIENLKITRGARLYIEDDRDMAYFYEWLRDCQSESAHRSPQGFHIDPQYGDSVTVFLMADVKMPSIAKSDVAPLEFRGTFHGMGHSIDLGTNELFLGTNAGEFYSTGFISRRAGSSAIVFGANPGHVENCFFYNSADRSHGYMFNPESLGAGFGEVINSYRNTSAGGSIDGPSGLRGLIASTPDDFEYGAAAYNLNRFYLSHRYMRGKELEVDDPALDPDVARCVRLIRDLYHDGSYRYAGWSPTGIPTALRTAEIPNYHDRMGIRIGVTRETYNPATGITGRDASFQNKQDIPDPDRADREDGPDSPIVRDQYGHADHHPLDADYMFFGQDLTSVTPEAPYPHALIRTTDNANRVYRSSGFYGSLVDRGFHFNIKAQAVHPKLTAIDFTCVRAVEHVHEFRRGEVDYADQRCYYPPMDDMPAQGLESFSTSAIEQSKGYTLKADPVTRNLLVYAFEGDPALSHLSYIPSTHEDDIFAHLVHPVKNAADGTPKVGEGYTPTTRLLHLVDRQDFNCPIAFEVTDSAWYQRRPRVYASVGPNGYTGWDGVVLPFTVHKVYAEIDGDYNRERDHGELTHFYGPYEDPDTEAPSHEYWLRKFTGVEAGGKLVFHRPGAVEDNNPPEPERRDYYYNNPYFSRVYGGVYTDGTTHSRPEYRPDDPTTTDDDDLVGRTYLDYPLVNHSYPYIVAWPGEKFYEFDLSGHFYHDRFPTTVLCPQVINFIARGSAETDDKGEPIATNVPIPVTDRTPILTFDHDGYKLTGTFAHLAPSAYMSVIDELGCNFERPDAGERWAVDPFRVYLTGSVANPMPITTRGHGTDIIGDQDPGQGEGDDQDSDESKLTELEIFVEDNVLCIMSPWEEPLQLPLYDINGRLLRQLPVYDGANYYPEIGAGYYIVRGFKFRIGG